MSDASGGAGALLPAGGKPAAAALNEAAAAAAKSVRAALTPAVLKRGRSRAAKHEHECDLCTRANTPAFMLACGECRAHERNPPCHACEAVASAPAAGHKEAQVRPGERSGDAGEPPPRTWWALFTACLGGGGDGGGGEGALGAGGGGGGGGGGDGGGEGGGGRKPLAAARSPARSGESAFTDVGSAGA